MQQSSTNPACCTCPTPKMRLGLQQACKKQPLIHLVSHELDTKGKHSEGFCLSLPGVQPCTLKGLDSNTFSILHCWFPMTSGVPPTHRGLQVNLGMVGFGDCRWFRVFSNLIKLTQSLAPINEITFSIIKVENSNPIDALTFRYKNSILKNITHTKYNISILWPLL